MKKTSKIILPLFVLALFVLYGCSGGAPTKAVTTETASAPQQQAAAEPSVPAATVVVQAAEPVAAAPEPEAATKTEPVAEATTTKTTTTTASSPQEVNIDLKNFAFSPDSVTVKKGTKVTWTQRDSAGHTVTSDEGIFESPLLSKGESWSYTFDKAGTYKYYCSPHPRMEGTIIVE